MKKFLIPICIVLIGCAAPETDGENQVDNSNAKVAAPIYEYIMGSKWVFDSENSEVKWSRHVIEGKSKKKMKILGATMEVEVDGMGVNLEGDVELKDGYLELTGDDYEKGAMIFDFAQIRLAQEKGHGLFDTKETSSCTLEYLSFEARSENEYQAKMNLSIKGHGEPIEGPVTITKDGDHINLKGEFVVNTLDFPLRENADAKAVKKDEITVDMNINFKESESFKKDSVQTN